MIALQIANCRFKSAGSMLTCSQRLRMPNARVSHDAVGLAGASASYHRGGWEDRAARSAVNAAATSAERGAQAVHRDPGREAQGSLDQPNERTSALKRALGRRVGYRYTRWSPSRPDIGTVQCVALNSEFLNVRSNLDQHNLESDIQGSGFRFSPRLR